MALSTSRDPMWDVWNVPDAGQVLESLRDITVGTTVTKSDWDSARFEILAGFAAIAEQLRRVPEAVLDDTRELVGLGLLEEAAGLEATPAVAGGSGAPGPAGAGLGPAGGAEGSAGTVKLAHAQLMALMDAAVARVTGGGIGAPAGGSSASGVERQYQSALERSQGKRDGWSIDHDKQALEAHVFPEMVWSRPLLEESCDIDELLSGSEASVEDWPVLVDLLRERVTAMQTFARDKDPGATFEDVLDDSFARKRARSPSPPAAAKRAHSEPSTVAGGALKGILEPEAIPSQQSDRQHRLMVYFKEWFHLRALEYDVTSLIKFYEFLILQMEEDSSVTIERRSDTELFEDYVREQQLRPARTPRPLVDDSNPRGGKDKNGKNAPNNPRNGNGKEGKGGKESGASCGVGHRTPDTGGGEAPALEPVAGEGHDPEDGEEEDDVMSLAHEFEFTPAEPGGGDYI
ncbi:hypothetical protein CYMTET_14341 [Cymbomonas tetramitiformis]|uniref:Uncharacterized protein n=1 Tax=Cymbomonas tetramitiformis TaxID=36881 RepID=A0AAE0GGS5_9CHLO|nr:hypothetical protein CYMTET_14341 [Cymbomonas tetramitiformis]